MYRLKFTLPDVNLSSSKKLYLILAGLTGILKFKESTLPPSSKIKRQQNNEDTLTQVFSYEFSEIFRNIFKNTSGKLLPHF